MSSPFDASGQAAIGFDAHRVMSRACEQASHSWEYGTAAEALLQLHNPELSIFGMNPFPNGKIPSPDILKTPGLLYAKKFIRLGRKTLIDGGGESCCLPFMQHSSIGRVFSPLTWATFTSSTIAVANWFLLIYPSTLPRTDTELVSNPAGAAGDPASLGNSCLLIGQTEKDYNIAAKDQANFILDEVPRWSNGAISHREDVAELWADSISMVPPYLSYRAVAIDDQSLLREACRQCELYEEILRPQRHQPLWQHIVGPQAQDLGKWSTGNGWIAAGLCRTFATIKKWEKSKDWVSEQDRLKDSIMGILKGVVLTSKTEDPSLLRNYLDDSTSFGETAGTAVLGAVAYRMAVLIPEEIEGTYTAFAEACWRAIVAHTDKESGTVGPTVDPLDWKSRESIQDGSSEGHSFAVMLFAARRDYMNWCDDTEIKV